ncbi:YceI family protein [Georgenia sp. 10Sc9-8]|uniref:YceI family protein n=1 Tax=Georgenia halotolerans TaxID=3028317 RepID=A0ABT5TVP2_9MICO|nr:YceI family protein [Georgenia halotolerans]
MPAGTYTIDTSHSEVGFTVRHAGISKVRGQFREFDGTLVIAEDPTASSVEVTIAAASVDTGDQGRDNHLRSADFWDAENKPTWTFVSKRVEGDGEELTVHGDLTINGVTREVPLEVEYNGAGTDPFGIARLGFSASTEISRKDFDLTWNAAMETGGFLVGDKVKILIEAETVAKQDEDDAAAAADVEASA